MCGSVAGTRLQQKDLTMGIYVTPRRPGSPERRRSERGAVIAEVLYALSLFSVLSLTAVSNAPLEETLRTSSYPDLHLVLYAGGAGTPSVLARLNLPTLERTDRDAKDRSIAVQVPTIAAGPITDSLSPGGTYSVQLGQGLKVCCDGGDNACANVDPAVPLEQASVTPAVDSAVKVLDTFRELKFNLETFQPADNTLLNPAASVENGFLVKATRVADFDAVQAQASAGGYVVCRLQQGRSILATGLLRLDAPIDPLGQSSRLQGGSVHLKYLAPATTPPTQPVR